MIGLTCSCPSNATISVTLVRNPEEIQAVARRRLHPARARLRSRPEPARARAHHPRDDKAFCVFSVECKGCKAQMFFEFFDEIVEGGQNRVEVTYKPGGKCTKDPNTCTKLFCDWSKCAH